VDGRNYDWLGLAAAVDLVFVMGYDTQSQIWGRCVASANSPLELLRHGLMQWLAVGVPASK
jgi:Di-N-acetylchitobiase